MACIRGNLFIESYLNSFLPEGRFSRIFEREIDDNSNVKFLSSVKAIHCLLVLSYIKFIPKFHDFLKKTTFSNKILS